MAEKFFNMQVGEATKYGFSIAETEWVAVIDSDIVLRKGWYENMRGYMDRSDAVEGSRIDHYRFDLPIDSSHILEDLVKLYLGENQF